MVFELRLDLSIRMLRGVRLHSIAVCVSSGLMLEKREGEREVGIHNGEESPGDRISARI